MSYIVKVESSFYLEVSDKLYKSLLMSDYNSVDFALNNCFKNNKRQLIEADVECLFDTTMDDNKGDFFRICDRLEELKQKEEE